MLTLGEYTLRREVSDEGSYVVVGDALRYPCESLPVALAALATLVGTLEPAAEARTQESEGHISGA